MFDKLAMQTKDLVQDNIQKIAELFPECVTESKEGDKTVVSIDFTALKRVLSGKIVEDSKEKYQFTWPDKSKIKLQANTPTSMTLRPCIRESIDFDNTKNVYIEGDNLQVLKILRETYLRKIDIIYIDPPYNTGKNLIYKNDYSLDLEEYESCSGDYCDGDRMSPNLTSNGRFHTDWLNMIYPRLLLSKSLLKDTGIIVITIDHHEVSNLEKICDEIFGESNHLATIIIKNNPSGRSTISGVSIAHEYALFYGATSNVTLGRLPRNEKQISRYKNQDCEGAFEWVNFRKHGGYKDESPTMYYPIYIKKDGSAFRIPKLEWNEELKEYDVLENPTGDEIVSYPIDENGQYRRWKWSLERAIKEQNEMSIRMDRNKIPSVYIKSYMNDEGMMPLSVWDDKRYSSTEYGANHLKDLFGGKSYFDYPKSVFAVEDCLKIANAHKGALILDFFSGSATTAEAVINLNREDNGSRSYILVQVPEKTNIESLGYKDGFKTICDVGKQRIRLVREKYIQTLDAQSLDFGFRAFKLDSSNMNPVYYAPNETRKDILDFASDNIKSDRTPEDLLFQVMLELGIELSAHIEKLIMFNKTIFCVDENYLLACFDENIDDKIITELAKKRPAHVVIRDSSLASDSVAINFEQIFKAYSPNTHIKVL